jgi:hypothetical protein
VVRAAVWVIARMMQSSDRCRWALSIASSRRGDRKCWLATHRTTSQSQPAAIRDPCGPRGRGAKARVILASKPYARTGEPARCMPGLVGRERPEGRPQGASPCERGACALCASVGEHGELSAVNHRSTQGTGWDHKGLASSTDVPTQAPQHREERSERDRSRTPGACIVVSADSLGDIVLADAHEFTRGRTSLPR